MCHKCENRLVAKLISTSLEFRVLDGSNNNKENTNGQAGSQLRRLVHSAYHDEISEPRLGKDIPIELSARSISNCICDQQESIPNENCLTNLFWLWGQFIDHDLDLTTGTDDSFPIKVPLEGTMLPECALEKDFKVEELGFTRSKFDENTGKDPSNPRQQINSITSYLDGSMIYGSDETRSKYLREFKCGRLRMSAGNCLPINDGKQDNAGHSFGAMYVAGDIRSNEHLGLTSFHTLFAREHNYWANLIKKHDSCLSDEETYQKAKVIVEAEIQAITFNEFLPELLGKCDGISNYNGYDCTVDPTISNVFSAAAYRFGHSMVASDLIKSRDLKLRDTFFSSHQIANNGGFEWILHDYACGLAEKLDVKIINDLRSFLFGHPAAGGHDLAALNIQRGRDHGLPDYNTYVENLCGKDQTIETFADLTNEETVNKLKSLYGSGPEGVAKLDVWIGGLLEKPYKDSLLGKLFHKIIKEQFEAIRDGDRFWYKRRLPCKIVKHIDNTLLSDIIKRNTSIDDIQKFAFKLQKSKPKKKKCVCSCCTHHHE